MIIKTRKLYILAVSFICQFIYAVRPQVEIMPIVEIQISKPKIQNKSKPKNLNSQCAINELGFGVWDFIGILGFGFEYIAIAPWCSGSIRDSGSLGTGSIPVGAVIYIH